MVALLCAAWLVLLALFQWQQYRATIEGSRRDAENLAQALHGRLAAVLARSVAMLGVIAASPTRSMLDGSTTSPDEAATAVARMRQLLDGFEEVSGTYLFDARGDMVLTSDPAAQSANVADRSFFTALRDQPEARVWFSEALVARTTGRWSVVVARPVRGPDGRFLGVATALFDADHEQTVLGEVDVAPGSVLQVRRRDTTELVARVPPMPALIGQVLPPGHPTRVAFTAGHLRGTSTHLSSTDGVERTWAFRCLEDYPFCVQVAVATDVYLAPWWGQLRWWIFAACATTLLVAIGLVRIERSESRQRAAQDALRESEERYRALFERSKVPMLLVEPATAAIIEANAAAIEFYGHSEARLRTMRVTELNVRPAEAVAAELARAHAGEQTVFLLPHRLASGEVRTVEVHAGPIELRGRPLIYAIHHDVTDRQRLQADLAKKMRELEMILNNSAVGIAFVRDHVIVGANAWFAEMFASTPHEVDHVPVRSFYGSDEDYDRTGRECAAVIARGERYTREAELVRRDGTRVWVRMTGQAVSPGEADGGTIWVLEDISAPRRVADELRAAKQASDDASRAKSLFLANMSHEIRTPMNGIIGLTELALDAGLVGLHREYVEKAHESAVSLLGIINDILDFSRVEAGKLELDVAELDLERILDRLRATFAPAFAKKGLTFEVSCDVTVPRRLVGDALRLSQILTNLVGNALKFTERGRVQLRVTLDGPVDGIVAPLRFAVRDTGTGITPSAVSHLFQPFSQGDSSTTRRYGGTGLGLAICQRLADLMGGRIDVESTLGAGSTFTFSVPLALSERETRPERRAPRPTYPALAGRAVLLVEDNAINRLVAVRFLEKVGLHVTTAVDGARALELLRAAPASVDAVLMDVQMPVMDGIEATEHIRADPHLQSLPVIAMTADAMPEDRERCLAAGMQGFVTKPIDATELYTTLDRALRTRPRASTALHS
ncbi:ATP-binding protein [Myxococcota bacterium]|nr:ATP-binding protein [Myxococcota bacterium]